MPGKIAFLPPENPAKRLRAARRRFSMVGLSRTCPLKAPESPTTRFQGLSRGLIPKPQIPPLKSFAGIQNAVDEFLPSRREVKAGRNQNRDSHIGIRCPNAPRVFQTGLLRSSVLAISKSIAPRSRQILSSASKMTSRSMNSIAVGTTFNLMISGTVRIA